MGVFSKSGEILLAGAGFLVGYEWAVSRWAERVGVPGGSIAARTLLTTGLPLACGYAFLLAVLFWPCLPVGRSGGLRVTVGPTAFTLSAFLGAIGIETALRLVGG